VGVKATVIDIKTGLEELTNDFRFTWCKEEGEPVARTVVPMTYQGACFFLSLITPSFPVIFLPWAPDVCMMLITIWLV
jgi:hypothetical protein